MRPRRLRCGTSMMPAAASSHSTPCPYVVRRASSLGFLQPVVATSRPPAAAPSPSVRVSSAGDHCTAASVASASPRARDRGEVGVRRAMPRQPSYHAYRAMSIQCPSPLRLTRPRGTRPRPAAGSDSPRSRSTSECDSSRRRYYRGIDSGGPCPCLPSECPRTRPTTHSC